MLFRSNGNLVVGQELTIGGTIKGFRAFYMKDDALTPLKNPELQMRVINYVFGSKPQPKAAAKVSNALVDQQQIEELCELI